MNISHKLIITMTSSLSFKGKTFVEVVNISTTLLVWCIYNRQMEIRIFTRKENLNEGKEFIFCMFGN